MLSNRPFPTSEKVADVPLTPMHLEIDSARATLPELNIQMSVLETSIRFYAPIWLANRTGFMLNFSSAPSTEESLPLPSQTSIDQFLCNDNSNGRRKSLDMLAAESNLSLDDILPQEAAFKELPSSKLPADNRIPLMESILATLEVSMPCNHFDHVTVSLPSSSTTSDLIRTVILEKAPKLRIQRVLDYALLYSSRADVSSRKVEPSPSAEEHLFSKFRESMKTDVSIKVSDVEEDDTSDDVPPKTKFNMSSMSSYEIIPYGTQLSNFKSMKVRLCLLVELALYRQVSGLVKSTASPSRRDLKARVLKKRRQIYVAPLFPFKGPVPYNPPKFISLIPDAVYVKVDTAAQWSKSVSLTSLSFEQVSVSSIGVNFDDVEEIYEFGLLKTKGQELFEMTTVVTFVPRTILVSLLSVPLLLRPIGHDSKHRVLEPNSIQVHHPMQSSGKGLMEVCTSTLETAAGWTGELDISRPSTTFVFLKTVDWLLKANVELIGGSFVVTFSEQSGQWPPYVIRNETSFQMRFMQGNSVEISNRGSNCWINVSPKSSCPYVWEFPQTLSKCITLQYECFGEWCNFDWIALDETDIFRVHRLKWAAPEVSDDIKESSMMWRPSPESSWSKVHCCLDIDVLYVFKTDKMDDLLDVIPLTRQHGGSLRFASISCQDTRRDVISRSIGRIAPRISGDNLDHADSFFDVNVVRVNMLLIAEYLSLLDDFGVDGESFGESEESRLSQLLSHGLTVDVILKHVSTKAIHKDVLYSALVDLRIVDSYVEAMDLLVEMIQRDLLIAFVPVAEMSEKLVEKPELFSCTEATVYFAPPSLASEKNEFEANRDFFEELAFVINSSGSTSKAFKCFSAAEYVDWVITCRQAIEVSWVRFMQDERLDESDVTIESFFTSVRLRGKAEGPTKVLEMTEVSASENESVSAISRYQLHEVSILEQDNALGGFSISLMLTSLSVTVMDLEPEELALLRFNDITISIDQINGDVPRIATSITVQDIQFDNQLLNPIFPLCAHPRRQQRSSEDVLPLHGLHQKGGEFPSLHIYFQQKLHFEAGSIAGLISARKNYIELLYFDIATLWFAPLHVDLEEELLVRCVRLSQRVREQLRRKDNARSMTTATTIDESTLYLAMQDLESSTLRKYIDHESEQSSARGVHFTILHLHPIDIMITFRPSNKFQTTTLEQSYIAVIAQLNSARICLNALIVENAFGTVGTILDVISKHYIYGIWHQIGVAIGKSDGFEGSVGLITNIGTGVIDVFYEPIAGLLGKEEGSFLNGLSRGASSLASRTIGGTSAFTSKLTGSIGKGMSLLTLDADFQHGRAMRRFDKAKNLTDGISQGTKGLSQNIVDGVVGVVAEPMKGWEKGGAVGLGLGLAKGILGFAFKPAIGVLDLASKATEGIRNSAFNETFYDPSNENMRQGRFRVPRTFGMNGEIIPYDTRAAAAQYIADKITCFDRENRPKISSHQILTRCLAQGATESYGMPVGDVYLLLTSQERLMLCKFNIQEEFRSKEHSGEADVVLIWSCPVSVVQEAVFDVQGDLILRVNRKVRIEGSWRDNNPVLHESSSKDYMVLQLLLEKTIGYRLAREQLLVPSDDAMVEFDVMKRFTSGLSSIVRATTKPILRLSGCVLYEYTVITKLKLESEDNGNPNNMNIDNFTPRSIAALLTDSSPLPKRKDFASLSYIYPLVNIASEGFFFEEVGRVSIRLERKDGQSILALKRKDEGGVLSETECSGVSFSFRSQADAVKWQGAIRRAAVTADTRSLGASASYDAVMKTISKIQKPKSSRSAIHDLELQMKVDSDRQAGLDSISNILVIPTAGNAAAVVDAVKLNIQQSML